ncbi:MAG: tetratricopeptide repeat protein [Flavobacteriales bacterium]
MKEIKSTLFLLIIPLCLSAQGKEYLDSIYRQSKLEKTDTARLRQLSLVVSNCFDDCEKYNHEILEIASKQLKRVKGKDLDLFKKYYSDAVNNMAYYRALEGDIENAMILIDSAITLRKQMDDTPGLADSYLTKGYLLKQKGKITDALDFYHKSLEMSRKAFDTLQMAHAHMNIGAAYELHKKYPEALNMLEQARRLYKAISFYHGESGALNGIASIQNTLGNADEAIKTYYQALDLLKKLDEKYGTAIILNNMAILYAGQNKYDQALDVYKKSYELRKEINDRDGMCLVTFNIGKIYIEKKDLKNAAKYAEKLLKLKEQMNYPVINKNTYELLFMVKEAQGDYKNALNYYKTYHFWMDSLNHSSSREAIIRSDERFKNTLKNFADSIELQKQIDLKDEVIARENTEKEIERKQKLIFLGGLSFSLVLVFITLVGITRLRKSNQIIVKQKKEVEHQKELVEEKNKEITASINYAKRIQEAILPSRYSLSENLKNGFVLFKPKDVVSGDFYWLESYSPAKTKTDNLKEEDKQKTIYFAAADCTGHGVPGAMVSVVCSNALSKALLEEKITEPGKILYRARELVVERFAKSSEDVKDGMDISLCALQGNTLYWAGANNPLWIIRKGMNEVEEIKPNKQPIGKVDNPQPFTTHTIELQEGDTIYVFTDGYQDQFGGEKRKKFKTSQLKKSLLNIQSKTINEQKLILEKEFETWKSDIEQTDDVCIIGVRL